MDQIEAKPTRYCGIQFRSRLEARCAVFLNYHESVRAWQYEPCKLTMLRKNWDYTPDFAVWLRSSSPKKTPDLLLECKPDAVSEEYLAVLMAFASEKLCGNGHLQTPYYHYGVAVPLYLFQADFYRFLFKLHAVCPEHRPVGHPPKTAMQVKNLLPQVFPQALLSLQTAAEYRFDLLHPRNQPCKAV